MNEENKLIEIVESLKSLALANDNYLSQADIDSALEELKFSKEQKETVCAYLKASKIEIENFDKDASYFETTIEEETQQTEEKTQEDLEDEEIKEGHLSFYLEELEELNTYESVDLSKLLEKVMAGDKTAENEMISLYLTAVIEWVSEYTDLGVLREDLIQEANIALVESVMGIKTEEKEIKDVTKYLKNKVESHIEKLVDETVKDENSRNDMLKYAQVIENARKAFVEEYKRTPTDEELAKRTGIEEELVTKITKLLN
ncbi:MAG: hypothetical protein E7252_02755 [Lachnospira sp.]|nr:hypothetical protein [Lachnospira sp.]